MKESFPKTEMRNYERQKALLQNPKYKIYKAIDENNVLLGFIALWNLDEFTYCEHIAIKSSARNGGTGSSIMKKCIEKFKDGFVLEVEPPTGEIEKRRIGFYQRLGMKLNDGYYLQPAMNHDTEPIELKIMSYPEILNDYQFENYTKKIHKIVYNKND